MPSSPMPMECSQCAARAPSLVTTVQWSPNTRVPGRPRVSIGSMASAVPGASRGPLPRLPWLATKGAMCMAVPMPCPP